MKRILLRSGKDPFSQINKYTAFSKNIFGSNNGNLIFSTAAHKLLSTGDTEVVANGLDFSKTNPAEINDKYDYVVLPLANAFRPSFERQLISITEFVEKLKIPAILLSSGAQSGPDGTYANLSRIENTVKRFCKAILNKSSHITVRGNRTAEYIKNLGFKDVLVIGGPSMTLNGPNYSPALSTPRNPNRIAYNFQPNKKLPADIFNNAEMEYDATYFPQDYKTAEMMLWGINRYKLGLHITPAHCQHRQFINNKAEFHIDAYSWMRSLSKFDMSFGPRIHGNIAALLSGIPAFVLAHDARTLELAEYHDIPHTTPAEINNIKTVNQIVELMNFDKFNNGIAKRCQVVIDFLNNNGLNTIYNEDQHTSLRQYEHDIQFTEFEPPIRTAWDKADSLERYQLATIYQQQLSIKKINKKIKNLQQK